MNDVVQSLLIICLWVVSICGLIEVGVRHGRRKRIREQKVRINELETKCYHTLVPVRLINGDIVAYLCTTCSDQVMPEDNPAHVSWELEISSVLNPPQPATEDTYADWYHDWSQRWDKNDAYYRHLRKQARQYSKYNY